MAVFSKPYVKYFVVESSQRRKVSCDRTRQDLLGWPLKGLEPPREDLKWVHICARSGYPEGYSDLWEFEPLLQVLLQVVVSVRQPPDLGRLRQRNRADSRHMGDPVLRRQIIVRDVPFSLRALNAARQRCQINSLTPAHQNDRKVPGRIRDDEPANASSHYSPCHYLHVPGLSGTIARVQGNWNGVAKELIRVWLRVFEQSYTLPFSAVLIESHPTSLDIFIHHPYNQGCSSKYWRNTTENQAHLRRLINSALGCFIFMSAARWHQNTADSQQDDGKLS